MIESLSNQSLELLKSLVATPSYSGEEISTAKLIQNYLDSKNIRTRRKHNNIYAYNAAYDVGKPTLLLNSHHDTVRENSGWTYDAFKPNIENNKLIGLGSNDAGASLVALIAAFCYFYRSEDLSHNLILLASAEEENSGKKGIQAVLPELGQIDLAIVGEPTGMQLAIAEKGLIVLRCQAHGRAGHAARDIGDNAILNAIKDIQWLSTYRFIKKSNTLGDVKLTVTMINAGTQHNVIPDSCEFTVDIRTTDKYTNEEVLKTVRENISSSFNSPSLCLQPSYISADHALVRTAAKIGISTFGSPTLSDQTFIAAPSVKIGPGRSERSHTANDFVFLDEIEEGISIYIKLLEQFLKRSY
jgi:acetylornithine deacetylase